MRKAILSTACGAVALALPFAAAVADAEPQSRPANAAFDRVGMIAYSAIGSSSGRAEVFTIGTDGSHRRQLTATGGFSPAWSPDGTRIVYQRRGAIWQMNAFGGVQERLITGESPSWAPSGQTIAYGCDRGGLCLLDLNTRVSRVLVPPTDESPVLGGATWSPDGAWIAFVRYVSPGEIEPNRQLFKVRTDGSELTPIPNTALRVSSPAWSPDGSTILFTIPGDARSGEFAADLWSIRPDGSDLIQVTRTFGDEWEGSWSPDGHRILVSSAGGARPDARGIWMMNPDGTAPELLVRGAGSGSWRPLYDANGDPAVPAISASGLRIAYVAATDNGFDLFTVRPDGTAIRRITKTGGVSGAAWSPDHTRIAYGQGPAPSGMFVREVATGQVTKVSDNLFFDGFESLAWSPDGRQLAWLAGRELVTYDFRTNRETSRFVAGAVCCPRGLTWSPNSHSIAFVNGTTGDIRIARTDRDDVRRLVHIPGSERNLDWSPDGRRILFSNTQGYFGSRLMSVLSDGTGLRTITSTGGLVKEPAWSLGGSRIAYYSDGPRPFGSSPRPGLWTSLPDGRTPQLLVQDRSVAYVDW